MRTAADPRLPHRPNGSGPSSGPGSGSRIPAALKTGCAVLWALPLGLVSFFLGALAVAELWSGDAKDGLSMLVFVVAIAGAASAPLVLLLRGRRARTEAPPFAPGTDAPGMDAPGMDAPGMDAPGMDGPATGTDRPATRAADAGEALQDEAPPRPEPGAITRAYGEAPWRRREAWKRPRIEASRPATARGLIVFALLWLAATGFGAYLYASGLGEGGSPGLFIGFGALGLAVLAVGLYRHLKGRKYRHVALTLDALPGAVGGTVAGHIETDIAPSASPGDGFHVMLTCYRRTERRDADGHRHVGHAPLWRDEAHLHGRAGGDGAHLTIPFFFHVPPDLPESTPAAAPNRIAWKVEASAEMPGIDFDASFEVPVFVVPERNRASAGDDDAARSYADAEVRRRFTEPTSPGIRLATTPEDGLHLYVGMARHKGVATLLTFLALVTAPLAVGAALDGGFMVLLILLFFTVVSAYGAWQYWTHASSVTVEHGRIVVRRGAFARGPETVLRCRDLAGVDLRTRTDGRYDLHLIRADLDDAEAAALRRQHLGRARTVLNVLQRTGLAGRRRREHGSLEEHMAQHGLLGDTIKAAEALGDRAEAEWIAERIEDAARRQRDGTG